MNFSLRWFFCNYSVYKKTNKTLTRKINTDENNFNYVRF